MRFRSRSVRARIIALLLIPLASLTGLWAYTSVSSVNQVRGLIQVSSDYRWFGNPADDLSRALQDERRAAVAYAAAPAGRGDVKALHQAEAATDTAAAVVRAHAADSERRHSLSAGQRTALDAVLARISGLQLLRATVEAPGADWDTLYGAYTDEQTPFFDLRIQLSDLQAGDLTQEAGNLIEMVRAREYISREDALMYGARAAGHFTTPEFQTFLATSDGERLLFQVHQPQLPEQEGALYAGFTAGQDYVDLGNLENSVSGLGAAAAAHGINGARWQTTLDSTLSSFSELNIQAAALAGDRAKSYAMGVVWRDIWVGVAGLAAVLLSVLLSLRIGRRLVRELIELRDSAFELAGVRLPDVMQRLREGEHVDLAAEAPQLPVRSADHDEIAQVGRAFNAVQRSAVEAAVEQAELRRGVAAVFVNLARRSQALLHRQLTLLDEMERRSDDPDELEDLFRLDHLTTRMRRHAEGLIILSGSAPGRNWRRPVRVLDVVRAAVGEVEDYARVRVHRMPAVAVVGGAVSDVVHLVAELVENAAVFSPPHTQVRIQGEEVANGFVLEIDDRGLGMGEEAMAAANTRLATGGEFDLADTDRLGLFVISRLSSRHGIRVSLRRSPYGGTTAVVLLPPELLAAVPARPGDASGGDETAERPVPVVHHRVGRDRPGGPRHAAPALTRAPALSRGPVPVEYEAPAEDETGSGSGPIALPRRRALPSRADSYLATMDGRARENGPGRETSRDLVVRRTGATPAPGQAVPAAVPNAVPSAAPAAVPTAVPPVAGAAAEQPAPLLPRRVRQANLAPQLRAAARDGSAEPSGQGHPAAPEQDARERSPEEVRATFASFQRGLSRGRATPLSGADRTAAGSGGASDPEPEGTLR